MKMRVTAALAVMAALGACGNNGAQTGLIGSLAGKLMGGGAVSAPAGPAGFTPEAVAARPQDFMVVNVPTVGISAPARLHTKNGARETWQVQNGATLAYEQGVMVATRGLIDDLLTASSAGVRAAIAAGGGSYQRGFETLDTQDQLVTTMLDCTMAADGVEEVDLGLRKVAMRKFSETCQNSAVSFQNAYWFDSAGQMLQSRQFVSVTVGYVYANRL